MRRRADRLLIAALLVGSLGAPGCTMLSRLVGFEEQLEEVQAKVRISGTVESDAPVEGALVVVVTTPETAPDGSPVLHPDGTQRHPAVDGYTRSDPGTFLFMLDAGEYRVGAYEDRNENGLLDPGERVTLPIENELLELAPGDHARVEISLHGHEVWQRDPIDVFKMVQRTAHEQGRFSLWAFSAKGALAPDLSDPRFGPEQGPFGLWQPMDFLNRELAGIYLLEPYDPGRIPVLYVHGISGYPQQFETLIGQLDRERFQPWFYFYPSGFRLDGISTHLADLLQELKVRYEFDEIAVVAHSMGGLVSRGAILKYAADTKSQDVKVFISINSPFGGDVKAKSTEGAPIALPLSFEDMDPSSEYLTWVYYEDPARTVFKPLPKPARHHMIMGFHGSGSPYNDGSVSIASQAHVDLQEHAASLRIWDYTHTGTLKQDRTVERVNRLLEETF
ncbi:MAG: alpha/beta hydrolase [Myxococcota bacterium]